MKWESQTNDSEAGPDEQSDIGSEGLMVGGLGGGVLVVGVVRSWGIGVMGYW